ncbi:MAG TPA: PKD domain-containing protein, partial [Thermoplasmatales archaeon]|nr:PKD domain-containing protein [Thermoplasmatales archaeon]
MRKKAFLEGILAIVISLMMLAPSTCLNGYASKTSISCGCDDKTINLGKMSIHPGDVFNGYSPRLKIDLKSGLEKVIYVDRHKSLTFAVDWEIRHDTPLWDDENWHFYITLYVYTDKDGDDWMVYTSSKKDIYDKPGSDDSGEGTLKCTFEYDPYGIDGLWVEKGGVVKGFIKLYVGYGRNYYKDYWEKSKRFPQSKLEDLTIILTGNDAPLKPQITDMPSSIRVGETELFSAKAVDPDGDSISYGWDWNGDNVVDEWTGYGKSGEEYGILHTFNEKGTYAVKVKARDYIWGYESEWSDPVTIKVTKVKSSKDKNNSKNLNHDVKAFRIIQNKNLVMLYGRSHHIIFSSSDRCITTISNLQISRHIMIRM